MKRVQSGSTFVEFGWWIGLKTACLPARGQCGVKDGFQYQLSLAFAAHRLIE